MSCRICEIGQPGCTVRELLDLGTEILRNAGVDTPILDAELLLANASGLSRLYLIVHPQNKICKSDADAYIQFIIRRRNREPLAYIIGQREFHGLSFTVTRKVLIPRPETELLVDTAISLTAGVNNPIAADIGTGSGSIAISLAAAVPDITVYADDISQDALKIAEKNAESLGVKGKIRFFQGNLLEPFNDLKFDIVLSNPPYIPTGEIEKLQPEIRLHEPIEALNGGPDGLDVYRELVPSTVQYLKPGGCLAVEIGVNQQKSVTDIFMKSGFDKVRARSDYAGIPRIIFGTWSAGK